MEKQTLPKRHLDEAEANQHECKESIQSLPYAVMISRPDIRYAPGKLARYAENMSLEYSAEVKQILRYPRGTVMMRLCLYNDGGQTGLVSYTQADFAGGNGGSESAREILMKCGDIM